VACLQSEKIWGFEIRQNRWLVSGALVDEFLKKRVGRVIVEGSQRSVSSVAELRECFQGPKFPLSKLFYDWPDYEQDQCRSYLETESRSLEFWMESPEFAMEWRRFIRRVRLQTLRFPDASATTLSLKNWVWLMDSNGRFLYLARCEDPTQRAQLRAYCFDRGMEAVH